MQKLRRGTRARPKRRNKHFAKRVGATTHAVDTVRLKIFKQVLMIAESPAFVGSLSISLEVKPRDNYNAHNDKRRAKFVSNF